MSKIKKLFEYLKTNDGKECIIAASTGALIGLAAITCSFVSIKLGMLIKENLILHEAIRNSNSIVGIWIGKNN